MYIQILKSKIHRAVVTDANLDYVGSITIDLDLMDRVGIYPGEKVQVVNNNNGARIETYTIPGERGSGTVCINGAGARLFMKGDVIIIMAYALVTPEEAQSFEAKVVFPNNQNKVVDE